jgi:hypothetical protein
MFDLPNGWTPRLRYDVPPGSWDEPGDVVAEFIPPSGALGGGGKPLSRDQAHKHAARPNAYPDAQPANSRPHALWHSPNT